MSIGCTVSGSDSKSFRVNDILRKLDGAHNLHNVPKLVVVEAGRGGNMPLSQL